MTRRKWHIGPLRPQNHRLAQYFPPVQLDAQNTSFHSNSHLSLSFKSSIQFIINTKTAGCLTFNKPFSEISNNNSKCFSKT
jgi:hypothetical protein